MSNTEAIVKFFTTNPNEAWLIVIVVAIATCFCVKHLLGAVTVWIRGYPPTPEGDD